MDKPKHLKVLALAMSLAFMGFVTGCKDDSGPSTSSGGPGGGATETNATPAPCDTDDECPKGIDCIHPSGDDAKGICNVNEMEVDGGEADSSTGVSSAAPAPCTSQDECPEGIACVFLSGDSGPGFCDVDEMNVMPPSSASPAPCTSQSECPDGITCIFPSGAGTPGFCDVLEMQAP